MCFRNPHELKWAFPSAVFPALLATPRRTEVGANPGERRRPPGAPRSSRGSSARWRGAGPVTHRCKNASDPTWACFRDAGNIWGVFAGLWEKYLLPNLALRCSRRHTNLSLKGGWGQRGWQPCQLPGCKLGSEPVAGTWMGQIKHLEPGPPVTASLF